MFILKEKYNKTTLPEKKTYSYLNMEDLTDLDYIHAKRNENKIFR